MAQLVKNLPANAGDCVQSLHWDDTLDKEMANNFRFILGKSHEQGAQRAIVHGVAKGWTRLSDFTFTFHFHALEKEMTTHSSILSV